MMKKMGDMAWMVLRHGSFGTQKRIRIEGTIAVCERIDADLI